jgi:hypothetical protein
LLQVLAPGVIVPGEFKNAVVDLRGSTNPQIKFRLPHLKPDAVAAIDGWIEYQGGELSRSEAIRRLIERCLKKWR